MSAPGDSDHASALRHHRACQGFPAVCCNPAGRRHRRDGGRHVPRRGMTVLSVPEQVCGVVLLLADGAVLLQLRDEKPEISDPGLWVFPGGHCEPGEAREAGALREFFEETRYRCARLHPLATYTAAELGYSRDFELTFYWELFDGIQDYQCCEGQQLRFVARWEAPGLPMPQYLMRVWDTAIAAAAEANR